MQVFEKIIEKLEEKVQINERFGYMTASDVTRECIDIVKEVAKECNNGWIPVSERLPEQMQECITCDKEGNIHRFTYNGKNFVDESQKPITEKHERYYIPIAWQPLPEPYQPKGE